MKRSTKWGFMAMCVMSMGVSCETTQKVDDPSTSVHDAAQQQIESTEDIRQAFDATQPHLDDIDRQADNILFEIAEDPSSVDVDLVEDNAEGIKESVNQIDIENARLEEALQDLVVATEIIDKSSAIIQGMEDVIASYEESDRELRKEALESTRAFLVLAFSMGFAMLVAGAFLALWVNPKLGGVVLGVGLLTLAIAAASQYYLEEIATIGLIAIIVGFFATLGIIIWQMSDHKKDKMAIKEIVHLIEEMKEHLTVGERREIFGPGGVASKLQNNMTREIIAKVKIKNGFRKL
tara:strand:+ start:190 stop:1068 length:879 start_codon:yes stop_codon:yes gene_type:complete